MSSNRLPVLASNIQRAIAEADKASALAAAKAIEAGEALVEAKELANHGEWLPFLKQAGINERTAQRYMRLAKARLSSDTVSHLGLTGALRFIRLRELACGQLAEAEAAAREGRTGYDELVPLETAILLMDEMVAMFPPDLLEGRA